MRTFLYMRTSQRIAAIGLITTCSLGMAGVAFAITPTSPDTGSRGWNSGLVVYNYDQKSDGHSIYTRWNGLSYPRLDNVLGYGSTVSVTPGGTITSLKACTNYAGDPDNCSGWVTG